MPDATDLTALPIGGESLAPLKRNASDLDELVNNPSGTVENRAGDTLRTYRQLESDFIAGGDAAIATFESDANTAIATYTMFTARGAWATATAYALNDVWTHTNGDKYLVLEAYTSGANEAADIAGGTVTLFRGRYQEEFTSLAAMKAASPSYAGQSFYLSVGGRSGTFETLPPGDYSAEIAADPLEGVYVLLNDGQTLKRESGKLYAEYFGFEVDHGYLSNQSAGLQAAINFARYQGIGTIYFAPHGGTAYVNVTVPDIHLEVISEGGKGKTELYPFDGNLPAIETKADAQAIADNGWDFVLGCALRGFTVKRGNVSTITGPLVKLWRYREANFDIALKGEYGGVGLQIINLFEISFPRVSVKGFDIGVDITDGPQADSIDFTNAQIQYNKVGMIIGRTRVAGEEITPDQNASINSLKLSGKLIGRFGGGNFISSGNTSLFETTATSSGTSATMPVASVTSFEVGEFVTVGTGNDLQYGFVISIGASDVTLDRSVIFASSDRVFQGRIGAVVCHCRALDLSSLQIEAFDAGLFVQSSNGVINVKDLALSSVVKPIFINGSVRRISIDGVIGGNAGAADWKLITVAASDSNKLGITLENCFLEGSGYYQFDANPELIADNFLDVRSSAKPVLFTYSEPDLGFYTAFYGNTGKSDKVVRGTVFRDTSQKYISAGKDFIREFYNAAGDDVIREVYDVSSDELKYTHSGDGIPFLSFECGDPTLADDPARATQIGGGAWNNKPVKFGGRYEWYDAGGNKRAKVGAPTSITDGVIISASPVI